MLHCFMNRLHRRIRHPQRIAVYRKIQPYLSAVNITAMYVLLHFPSFPVPVTIGLFMSSIVCKSSKAFTPGQTLLFTLPPQSGSPDTESHRSTPSGSSIGSFCGYPPVPLPLLDPRYRAFSRPCQNNWHLPPAGFPALLRTRIPSGRNWGWHAFCCLCARYAMPAFRYSLSH